MARCTLPGILLGLLLQLTFYYIAVPTYEFFLSNCSKVPNFSAFVYLCKALTGIQWLKKELWPFSFLLFLESSLILLSIVFKTFSYYTTEIRTDTITSRKQNKHCSKLSAQNMLLSFREMMCFIQHTTSLLDFLKFQQVKLFSTLSRGILKWSKVQQVLQFCL